MAILVIDSAAASRKAVAEQLEDLRYSSIHAFQDFDAATAMLEEKAKRHEPCNVEMILLAVAQNDWSCLRAARTLQALHDVPVIILAEPTPEAKKMAFALGAADFVGTPVDKFELLMRARATLRWRLEYERRLAREAELMDAIHQLASGAQAKTPEHLDTLTGTLSTAAFFTSAEREWKRSARGSRPMALVVVSLDEFARYRDTYGPRVSDKCLQQVAATLKASLRRPGDVVARFSEDSFAVLLPETPTEGARFVAENIQARVAELHIAQAHASTPLAAAPETLTVTLSVLTAATPDANGLGDFLKNADWALSEARSNHDGLIHETQVGGRILKAI